MQLGFGENFVHIFNFWICRTLFECIFSLHFKIFIHLNLFVDFFSIGINYSLNQIRHASFSKMQ